MTKAQQAVIDTLRSVPNARIERWGYGVSTGFWLVQPDPSGVAEMRTTKLRRSTWRALEQARLVKRVELHGASFTKPVWVAA